MSRSLFGYGMSDYASPRHTLGGYAEYAPPARLHRCAEAVWHHTTPLEFGGGPGASHRVLPDPSLSIAFTCYRDDGSRATDPRVVVIGPITIPRPFPLEPSFEMAAVKLKLEWVEPLLGLCPSDHADRIDDLSPLRPAFAAPLLDALAATHSAEHAVAVLALAVERLLLRCRTAHDRSARLALDTVRRSRGRIEVGPLAADLGTSDRHLRRVVRHAAGVGLKAYARAVRFTTAVTAADHAARPCWARLAAESGFYDQAHLVREFRALSGLPPDRLYRERRAESEMSNPS